MPRRGSGEPPFVVMTVLELVYEAVDVVRLPRFPGSTLRGGVGRALRPMACTTGASSCDGCGRRAVCPYGVLWETTTPEREDVPKRYRTDPQRPYVIAPPYIDRPFDLRPGEFLSFRIHLFGPARAFVPLLVVAAREAGRSGFGQRRGRSELIAADRLDPPGGECTILYRLGEEIRAVPACPGWNVSPKASGDFCGDVRLDFLTPLYLKAGGERAMVFDPEVFTARLSERLTSLSIVYEGTSPFDDATRLRELSRALRCREVQIRHVEFERYSARSDRRLDMAGFVGSVVVEAVPEPLVSLWECAEAVHVGKQCSFGFGRVAVTRLEGVR